MSRKRVPPPSRPEPALVVAGASWLALVAATSVGSAPVDQLRAVVRAEGVEATAGAPLRLVVQTYDAGAVRGGLPLGQARARGSTQRAITPAELAAGVSVSVPQLAATGSSVVVAWVEAGMPDLEFDALRARPAPNALVGSAHGGVDTARLVLRHG